jgi:acyl dehydratase
VAIDRHQHVGVVSEPRVVEVEAGALRFFAKATGEKNPIYFDYNAARAAGHRGVLAPPTYLFTLHMGSPAERGDLFNSKSGLGINPAQILHGEQSFIYHRAICAGDCLSLVTTTTDIYEKKAGALEFVVQDTRCSNAAGNVCVEMRQVVVVRNS